MIHARGKLLALALLASSCLPVTITCDPGDFDAVIQIRDGWRDDGAVVITDTYWDGGWYDDWGWGGDFYFDYWD